MPRPNKPRWREQQGAWVSKIDGRLHTLARGKGNKAEANRRLKELLEEAKKPPSRDPPTVFLVFDAFLKYVKAEKRPLTLEFYRRNLDGFRRHVGDDTAAEDVLPKHVTAWLGAHEWGPTTRHGAITAVKRAMSWAKQQGHIAVNALADMERPTPRARAAIMTGEQARGLFDAIEDREFRDLLVVLEQTGMRPSEAMGLEARMIDFEKKVIETVGKGRARTIYLNETVTELLRDLAAKWPDGPILRNTHGKPWNRHATKSRFARLRIKLGLGREATAESYRHVFVTDGLERGVEVATLAELVGHRGTRMIEKHYSKLKERKDHLAEAVRKVRPDDQTSRVRSASRPGPCSDPASSPEGDAS